MYAWLHPEIFRLQTEWIAENVGTYNIRYVIHLGDVVQHNRDGEWRIARDAISQLDGKVPYAIALGNHDLGPDGKATNRNTFFENYFPVSEFKTWDTFGEVYDKEPEKAANCYHVFSAGGREWLVLLLEFGPRDDVLRWANEVVSRHPDHSVILVTHAYLHNDGKRYDRNLKTQHYPPHVYGLAQGEGGLNDGKQIWDKLVFNHPNMTMVLSGHVCVAARLASKGRSGNTVCQMLVDYQDQERGGTGWLRLLQFPPGATSVHVRDYSPLLDQWSSHPDRQFVMKLSPATKPGKQD